MILDIIKKRRSIFPVQYNGKEIARESIETILESANYAPSHKKTNPWRFKVIAGDQRRKLGEFLSETYKEKTAVPKDINARNLLNNPQKAGAIIAICMQRDPKESLPEWEEVASVAMAVQNMWLTATDLGIGAYWSSPGLIKFFGGFTDLAEGERCLGFFYMGYSDQEATAYERTSIEEKVTWL